MNVIVFGNRIIYGGGEKMYNWVTSVMLDHGYNVFFATPQVDDEYIVKLKNVGLYGRVQVVEYPHSIKIKHPIVYYKSIKKIFCENHIDLLLIFGGSLVEQIAAKRVGTKVILSERWYPNARKFLSRILKQIQYKISDGYVFQTREAGLCYGNSIMKRAVVIPNAIIDKLVDPLPVLRKEIVSVGRLSPEKNHKLLINSFAVFSKKHPDFKLVLYGSGPLKNDLNTLANSLGVNEKLEIVEGKRNISELINGASLFVMTSNVEGMPNALIEAMAMAVPSISTDCPAYGPRMLIEHGINGYLVPLNDIAALESTMEEVISNTHIDELKRESLKIRKKLDPQILGPKWIEYFEQVVRK